jgi:hypothetical protein
MAKASLFFLTGVGTIAVPVGFFEPRLISEPQLLLGFGVSMYLMASLVRRRRRSEAGAKEHAPIVPGFVRQNVDPATT